MNNNTNNKNTNKPRNRRARRRRPQKGSKTNGQEIDVMSYDGLKTNKMTFFKDIIPARVFTRLKFIANRRLLNAIGSSGSIQFNANGAFDFDPAVASNAVAGFPEWSNFFQRYRVHGVRVKCRFIAATGQVAICNIGFEDVVYAANAKGQNDFDGPNQLTSLSNPQNFCELDMYRNALQVVGDAVPYTEANYTGTAAANPVALWYVSVAADTVTAGLGTCDVAIRAEFWIDTEFWERYAISSEPSPLQKKAKEMNRILNEFKPYEETKK